MNDFPDITNVLQESFANNKKNVPLCNHPILKIIVFGDQQMIVSILGDWVVSLNYTVIRTPNCLH